MNQLRLEFNSDGFKEILCSDGVHGLVDSTTEKIKTKADAGIQGASEGFQASSFLGNYGGGRWIGVVSTTDYESMVAEAEGKALSKAVSG